MYFKKSVEVSHKEIRKNSLSNPQMAYRKQSTDEIDWEISRSNF